MNSLILVIIYIRSNKKYYFLSYCYFDSNISSIYPESLNMPANILLLVKGCLNKEQTILLSIIILVLALSLTISSIDTLINAISSLIVVDGNKVIKFKGSYLNLSKQIILLLSLIAFFLASQGFSILYLFLLADLLCCAAVFPVFYGCY